MNKFFKCATLVVGVLAVHFAANDARAQNDRSKWPEVCVIDVMKIYKEYPAFKGRMEDLQQQVKRFTDDQRVTFNRIKKMQQEADRLNAGTPNHKRLEDDILKAKSEMQILQVKKQKDFLGAEAKIHLDIYRIIQDEVDNFSKFYNVRLVINYSSAKVDTNNPKSVKLKILGPIVVHQQADITNTILGVLNSRYKQTSGRPKRRDVPRK